MRVFRLKVTLHGTRPPVWRRIETPADVTLAQVHRILQIAMGWNDSHLHEFEQGRVRYGVSDREFGIHRESEQTTRLSDVLRTPGDRLDYLYDFGDSWLHRIVLEAVGEAPSAVPPRVIKARRAGPPDDVGGYPGFAMFLEAMADPRHPDHRDRLEWWGGPFDPNHVDVAGINRALARIRVKPVPSGRAAAARVKREAPFAEMMRLIRTGQPLPPEPPGPDERFLTRLAERARDETTILSDREVNFLASEIGAILGPLVSQAPDVSPTLAADIVRWGPVEAKCRLARARRGLSTKDAARQLKLPHYRILAVERGVDPSFRLEHAVRYFRLLGLESWVTGQWAHANRELARRLGLG